MEGMKAPPSESEDDEFFSAGESDSEESKVTATESEMTSASATAASARSTEESDCESDGLPEWERVERASALKEEGNDHFRTGAAEAAVLQYRAGLRICPKSEGELRAALYGNMAAAYVKQDDHERAVECCDKAVKYKEHYVKVYMRRAASHEKLDNLEKALADYKTVLELDPRNGVAIDGVQRLPPLIHEQQEKMKAEMMSKLKDLGNAVLKPFGLSTTNFQFNQDPKTGGYSVNFQR
ncbi:tetratricopeptide repeat protein 1-like [Sycon ciliatum]|uniref:tetratricopeptide repeat protein 1-like n=1 Tax=Sycon ciliatum TaxID=27933 RepID=UPI0020A9BCE9|eukprot:scpid44165/ scgid17065/ Tetratricopeptide repeat protein 1